MQSASFRCITQVTYIADFCVVLVVLEYAQVLKAPGFTQDTSADDSLNQSAILRSEYAVIHTQLSPQTAKTGSSPGCVYG